VPDPRVTNPELFDLTKPDAPIPQFVNALKNAGIEVAGEQVTEGITYQVLKDKDGNHFVVGVYDLDPNLFPAEYRDLAGPIPLFIAQTDEKGEWGWEDMRAEHTTIFTGIPVGTYLGGYGDADNYNKIVSTQLEHFNGGAVNIGRGLIQPKEGVFNYGSSDSDVNKILVRMESDMKMGYHVIDSQDFPNWLRNANEEDVRKFVEARIRDMLTRYKGKIKIFSLLNEYNHPNGDPFLNKLGKDYYLYVFKYARSIDAGAILMLNDFNNHSLHTTGPSRLAQTQKLVQNLREENLVDVVGVQFNLHVDDPFDVNDVVTNLRSFGIPVVITEANVRLNGVPHSPNRWLRQAKLYAEMYEACINSGVCIGFNTLQIGDKWSVFEQSYGFQDSDPTLFDDNLRPKFAYYLMISEVLITRQFSSEVR
jgi:GH35 family endo-1,4-beta-xylanase